MIQHQTGIAIYCVSHFIARLHQLLKSYTIWSSCLLKYIYNAVVCSVDHIVSIKTTKIVYILWCCHDLNVCYLAQLWNVCLFLWKWADAILWPYLGGQCDPKDLSFVNKPNPSLFSYHFWWSIRRKGLSNIVTKYVFGLIKSIPKPEQMILSSAHFIIRTVSSEKGRQHANDILPFPLEPVSKTWKCW